MLLQSYAPSAAMHWDKLWILEVIWSSVSARCWVESMCSVVLLNPPGGTGLVYAPYQICTSWTHLLRIWLEFKKQYWIVEMILIYVGGTGCVTSRFCYCFCTYTFQGGFDKDEGKASMLRCALSFSSLDLPSLLLLLCQVWSVFTHLLFANFAKIFQSKIVQDKNETLILLQKLQRTFHL